MINENIKAIRKQKGISQEELAIQLNVVRQTISKWEKGLSVPDADMIIKLSNIFDVPVNQILGSTIVNKSNENEIVEQLIRMNEQFAIKNKRIKTIMKIILGIIISFLVMGILLLFIGFISLDSFNSYQTETKVEKIE